MDFNLLQAFTGRKPRSLDHLPLTGRYAIRNAHLNNEGQTIPSLRTFSRLAGFWKVCFLECLQGVILRNGMRHLETARWHADLVLKREKQADHFGRRAAAVLARARNGNDETL
jgi:hypothetical protein